jgi:hypothetical protein
MAESCPNPTPMFDETYAGMRDSRFEELNQKYVINPQQQVDALPAPTPKIGEEDAA